MSLLAHRTSSPLTEMFDWLDTVAPLRTAWSDYIPVEEFVEDGKYVVRADLPGIDPEKDVDVSIVDNVLTIHGERREEQHDKQRSEVRYGSFTRSFRLPDGCRTEDVVATYDSGVLQVTLPVAEPAAEPQRVPITTKKTEG